jgi:hypothetical protein
MLKTKKYNRYLLDDQYSSHGAMVQIKHIYRSTLRCPSHAQRDVPMLSVRFVKRIFFFVGRNFCNVSQQTNCRFSS